eukprot:3619193-Rhodomonas_salina.1
MAVLLDWNTWRNRRPLFAAELQAPVWDTVEARPPTPHTGMPLSLLHRLPPLLPYLLPPFPPPFLPPLEKWLLRMTRASS